MKTSMLYLSVSIFASALVISLAWCWTTAHQPNRWLYMRDAGHPTLIDTANGYFYKTAPRCK